jgi:hypothetical protein
MLAIISLALFVSENNGMAMLPRCGGISPGRSDANVRYFGKVSDISTSVAAPGLSWGNHIFSKHNIFLAKLKVNPILCKKQDKNDMNNRN